MEPLLAHDITPGRVCGIEDLPEYFCHLLSDSTDGVVAATISDYREYKKLVLDRSPLDSYHYDIFCDDATEEEIEEYLADVSREDDYGYNYLSSLTDRMSDILDEIAPEGYSFYGRADRKDGQFSVMGWWAL